LPGLSHIDNQGDDARSTRERKPPQSGEAKPSRASQAIDEHEADTEILPHVEIFGQGVPAGYSFLESPTSLLTE